MNIIALRDKEKRLKYPKVKYKEYVLLDGSRKKLVQQVGNGYIIKRFDKTPIPKKPTDVVCPHFLELKWAYGCPFNCSWCYLKGTLRFLPTKTCPKVKDYKLIELHLASFFDETVSSSYPEEVLNTGEIADSLMYENNGNPFSKFIIEIFETQTKHKLLFLSKSNAIHNLLNIGGHKQVITSFTLNAVPVAKRWERGAPSVIERIKAAKELAEVGYEVRIRIDPMVPVENWKCIYRDLIDMIFSNFTPERITLGSLRGLQTTINNTDDASWVKYLSEWSNWGRKVEHKVRYNMYSYLIIYLQENYDYKNIGLCKETKKMWEDLRMDYKKIKCNCIL